MEKENIQRINGIHTDSSPIDQPKNTARFVLNGVIENTEGDFGFIGNEESNILSFDLPADYIPIGQVGVGNNETVIFLANETNPLGVGVVNSMIILKKEDSYELVISSTLLNFRVSNQIDAIFRLRRGCERVIYWVDGLNVPRYFNIDKPHLFKTLGAWDVDKFALFRKYESIPTFDNVEIEENGNILAGSYNAAIQYVDEDLNPTEWITTSDPILIYHSRTNTNFYEIRGSTNKQTQYQSFGPTGKSIKFTFGNLDSTYPYYRVAIIEANNGSGQISKVTTSDIISTITTQYTFTGNNPTILTENEILEFKEYIETADHIEQLENRLLLAGTKGKQANLCKLQKYASMIRAEGVSDTINLTDITTEGNPKRGTVYFEKTGYQPGEIYSFGIVYVFKDGSLSPVYHIPGTHPSMVSQNGVPKPTVYGDFHMNVGAVANGGNSLTTAKYNNPANCDEDYWGKDSEGHVLEGEAVRHHRFPTRKEENLSWVTKTDSVTNYYILQLIIANINPLILYTETFEVEYKLNGVTYTYPSTTVSNVVITAPVTINIAVSIYLATDIVVTIGGVDYNYPADFPVADGDGLWGISSTIENRPSSVVEATTMGIVFYNIYQPEEFNDEITGYYIVRNERTDINKMVLDTVALRPMVVYENFIGFGTQVPTGLTSSISDEYFAFVGGEHLFHNKEYTSVDRIEMVEQRTVMTPAVTDAGVATQETTEDVMAGTSYDPEVAKKGTTDYDGFSLHTYSYLTGNTTANYAFGLSFAPDSVFYLPALSSYVDGVNEIYNTTSDNRIGVIKTDVVSGAAINAAVGEGHAVWAILRKNVSDPYSDFRTLPYYKETVNPILFNGCNDPDPCKTDVIYHGDTFTSAINYNTTCYYSTVLAERLIKRGVWKTILGVALMIVGVVVGVIFSETVVGIPLGGAMVQAGLALLKSGVTAQKLAKAYLEDYDKGLRNTLGDTRIVAAFPTYSSSVNDDEIQFFNYTFKNLFLESTVNANLRVGSTGIVSDFMDAYNFNITSDQMNQYVLEKLTVLDENQQDGRLFQGITAAEIYETNPDYERINKQKVFFHLPIEYDCCSPCLECFPQRIYYSQQAFQEELADNYRVFLANNYRDIEGETGIITDLFKIQNNLYIHTESALWHLPQNIQERITGDVVSYIGTGEYFSIPPRKIVDAHNSSGGTRHKWATVKTMYGVFFVSDNERKVFLFNGTELKDISSQGMFQWFRKNVTFNANEQYKDYNDNRTYEYLNNPSNPLGLGFVATFDENKQRLIFTKKDFLIDKATDDHRIYYSDGHFYYFENYQDTIDTYESNGYTYLGITFDKMYFIKVEQVYDIGVGDFIMETTTVDVTGFLYDEYIGSDASWTLSYSLKTNTWTSFHSYLPNFYLYNDNMFYSWKHGDNGLWKHKREGHYQCFYGDGFRQPFIVEYVSLSNPLVTRIWDYLEFLTTAKKYHVDYDQFYEDRYVTFNKIMLYNSHQNTGELTMEVKNTKLLPENYLFQQITNVASNIVLDKNEINWSINNIRNKVDDYTLPMFNSTIEDIQSEYFIDKIINPLVMDMNKTWSQQEKFMDKYLVIRFIFDNFDNVKLIFNYSIEHETISYR